MTTNNLECPSANYDKLNEKQQFSRSLMSCCEIHLILICLFIRFLIALMAIQSCWSFVLACVDIYSLNTKTDLHSPRLIKAFVVGDWVRQLNTPALSVFYSSSPLLLHTSTILMFVLYCHSRVHVFLMGSIYLNNNQKHYFFNSGITEQFDHFLYFCISMYHLSLHNGHRNKSFLFFLCYIVHMWFQERIGFPFSFVEQEHLFSNEIVTTCSLPFDGSLMVMFAADHCNQLLCSSFCFCWCGYSIHERHRLLHDDRDTTIMQS